MSGRNTNVDGPELNRQEMCDLVNNAHMEGDEAWELMKAALLKTLIRTENKHIILNQ